MRLLPKKNEVKKPIKQIVEEQRKEVIKGIEEELKLLNRVREESKIEASKLKEDILRQIGELDGQKRQLFLEVNDLEEKKRKAKEPLDKEWMFLKENQRKYLRDNKQLYEKIEIIELSAKQLDAKIKKFERDNNKFQIKEKELKEAINTYYARQRVLTEQENKVKEANILLARQIRNFEKDMVKQRNEIKKQKILLALRIKK